MRIKNFTLMLMAVLFSTVGFAQKSFTAGMDIATDRQTTVKTLVKQTRMGNNAFAANQQNTSTSSRAKTRAKAQELVTPPEKGEVEYYTLTGKATANNQTESVSRQIKIVWDDEDEDVVYIQGLSYYMPNSFVKGTFNKEGDQVIILAGQYMGNPGADLYFGGYGDGKELSDVVAEYNEKEGSFTFSDYLLDNGDPKELGFYAYFAPGVTITPLEDDPEIPVEIPKDLEIEKYAYSAYDYFQDNAEVSGNLNIGIYGEDVYIQGMSTDYPEAWVKGYFQDEKTVIIPSGQLLTDERSIYFIAINDNYDIVDSYTLIYDPETGVFEEGPEAPMINAYKDKIEYSVWQFYYGYVIKPITEQAATPAKSVVTTIKYEVSGDDVLQFTLAKVDTDGEGLVVEKLSYKLWYADMEGQTYEAKFTKENYPTLEEDMEEIPATFTDDKYIKEGALTLNFSDERTWSMIGIQGVYYGGEERHESEIAWYTPTWPQSTNLPDGLTVTEHTLKGTTSKGAAVERTVGLAFDGDDIYIRGMGQTNDYAWVKGTKNTDGAYVFQSGQTLGIYYGEDKLFFLGYDDENGFTNPVLQVNSADGVYEFETEIVENADYTDKSYYVVWLEAGATITIAEAQEEVPTPVEVPEGLETEVWSFSATDYFDSTPVSRSVNVGFDGEDVYVQGLFEYVRDAWVKGTLEDGVITFATGQYMDPVSISDLWFIGYNMNSGISDFTMTYDEENGVMSNSSEDELIGLNQYKAKVQQTLYEFYHTVTIKKITEKIATPATPSVDHIKFSVYGDVAEFSIPTVDVDGDGLVTDKLSYKLYYDEGDGEAKEVVFTTDLYEYLEEDMTVIPYGFIDGVDEEDGSVFEYDFLSNGVYLNMDYSTWTRVGIQSIYTGGGETNVSEIGWYTIIVPQVISLPEGAEVATYAFTGTYYNRNGNVEFTKSVNVAKVDDDVYVQGVGRADATTWIKGTKNPETGVYTFARGQYLGLYDASDEPSYLFLMGYSDMLGSLDVKMTYDEETDVFTATTEMVENADYVDKLFYLTRILSGAQIMPIPDVAATPAAPSIKNLAYTVYGNKAEFTIPTTDVEGAPILPGKLAYKLYYDEGDSVAHEVTFAADLYDYLEEDMTVVPYGFLDAVDEEGNPASYDFFADAVYMNMSMGTWVRIGIQSVYAGGEETNVSEISWYTPAWPQIVELPEGAEVATYGFNGEYYGTNGNTGFSKQVQVAKVGDDVYVQGVGSQDYETWIKGTKDADSNTYTFTPGQYLGAAAQYRVFLFMVGYDDNEGVIDFKMSYDEETGIFTTVTDMAENATYTDKLYYLNIINAGAQLIPAENPDAISVVNAEAEEGAARYNIAGQRVGKNYKGIIVEGGRKFLQK